MKINEDKPLNTSLTDSQISVFFECYSDQKSVKYNLPFLFKFPKCIAIDTIKQSVEQIVDNYSAFSLIITMENGVPYFTKRLNKNKNIKITQVKQSELSTIKSNFIKPFKLLNNELYRIELVSTENFNYLLLDIHHLIFDGSSLNIFKHCLQSLLEGKEMPGENQDILEVLKAQVEGVKENETNENIEYFKKYLGGVDTNSSILPDKFGVEKTTSSKSIKASLKIKDELSKFIKENGITANIFFCGAFTYALAKFNSTDESLFLTASSGRYGKDLDNTIGMFVRLWPFYYKIDEELSPKDFFKKLKVVYSETLKHEYVPYNELEKELNISPRVEYVFQNTMLENFEVNSALIEVEKIDVGELDGDLCLMAMDGGDDYFDFILDYNTSLYEDATMEHFIEFYKVIATELLHCQKLCEMNLVSEKQKQELFSFCDNECPQMDSSVVDIFRQTAKKYANNIAVVFDDKKYTYKQLDEITDNLAGYLIQNGIQKGDVVSILVHRGQFMPIGAIGVIKSGAIYQPLDPSYPAERLNLMITDSQAKFLIADKDLRPTITEYSGKTLYTDETEVLPNSKETMPTIKNTDGLVLLYTSGTTGKPKGVVWEHRNLINCMDWVIKNFELNSESKQVAYASFGFDAHAIDMYSILFAGGQLHIIKEEDRLDLIKLDKYFDNEKITHVGMTTQVARQFALMTKASSLKVIYCGGEKLVALTPPKNVKFFNLYGPTETTIFVTYHIVKDDNPRIPIGKPIDNIKAYVVDKYNRLLPIGACGELWISGVQVSRGYLNRPEQMEKAYISNPFNQDEKYNRIYKTGDIVRWFSDGNIDFVGRQDKQVKIRGFRIELTEIEKVVRDYEDVLDATTVAFDDEAGNKYICAYVVSNQKIDEEKMKEFIASQKPSYMVPSFIIQLDKIPLNQNQKVDKRALPKPERKVENLVPPTTQMQKQIFEKVVEVLGHRELGINTDLYSAGLSSIASLKLIVSLCKTFNVEMNIQALKDNSTIETLEKFITSSSQIEKSKIYQDYALSKVQEGIFVECVANSNSTIYNIPVLFEIDKKIDLNKLKESINNMIEAHPFLKTTFFSLENGDIRQRRNDDIALEENEIEIIKTKNIEDIKRELIKPFEMLNHRLFRIKIIETEKQNYLFMDFHHIICDGTSLRIIIDDISRAYAGEILEKETFSSFENVLREEKKLKTNQLENAKKYFQNLVSDIETKCLIEGDACEKITKKVSVFNYRCNKLNVKEIQDFCNKNSISLNGFFSSAFGFLLSKYAHRFDSIFAGVYNGRSDAQMENIVGMFVKTSPIVCKIDNNVAVIDYIKNITQQLVETMSHDIYAFSQMAQDLEINSDILFAYQGDNFLFNKICGEKAKLINLEISAPKANITYFVSLDGDNVLFDCEYIDAYSKHFIKNFALTFEQICLEFLKKDSVGQVDILCDETQKEIQEFNLTEVDFDSSQTVIDLFRQIVKQFPDNIAVVYKDNAYTYKQLDDITDKCAKHLKKMGVQKETVVGVLIPRNEFMPICALSILKAGGAYLPMDCSYPAERLNFMLQDAGASVVITNGDLNKIIESYSCPRIMVDEILSYNDSDVVLDAPSAEDLFIMLYTSGTTGNPKGVLLEHQNIATMCNWARKYYDLKPGARWAAYASFGFDANMFDMYPTLTSGATLYVIDEGIRLDLKLLAKYFNDNNITHSFVTTQIGRQMALMPDFKTLQHLSTGGEKLLALNPPKFKLHNIYGPTETTVLITIYELTNYVDDIPIGKPLDNTKIHIVDKYGKEVPFGAVGELRVCGKQVSRGYKNRPEQTEKVFIKNSYDTSIDYERMYCTGDLVQVKADGQVHYIGRRDGQVKIRGFRIELGEVERVIREFEGIKDATVIAAENLSGDKYLVAYIVSDKKVDIDALNKFIAGQKPQYMVPAITMQIDKIPLNQNQKVDKRALPKPEKVERDNGRLPSTDLEQKLADIFAQVLGLNKVFADDDFFALGGSSISASKVVLKCMNEGINVVYKNIFDCSTPEKLASCILSQNTQEPSFATTNDDEEEFNEELSNVLNHNTSKFVDEISNKPLKKALLIGATGFLGIHVLKELLDSGCEKIYCVVRQGKTQSSESRLKMLLMYYFDDTFSEEIGKRIVVIDADIRDDDFANSVKGCDYDYIINCAASVKHFAKGNALEQINYLAVKNLIKLALSENKSLIQISTLSIAGENVNNKFEDDFKLKENMLYFGQDLENKYARTKFEAEKAILEAVQNNGLKAKIIRVGNLMSRYKDGEFQINFTTNAFMTQLNAYINLKCFPVDELDTYVEFSPIDAVAKAIRTLSTTPEKFTVFHVNNCHIVHMSNVIEAMQKCGLEMQIVSQQEFDKRFKEFLNDDEKNVKISSLLSYKSEANNIRKLIDSDNSFTIKALYRLGFSWPLIDEKYVEMVIKKLHSLGFFDAD